MSYMQFQQCCESCGEKWNAAFGIVGITIIAQPPTKCPKCGSEKIRKCADGWDWTPIGQVQVIENEQELSSLVNSMSIPTPPSYVIRDWGCDRVLDIVRVDEPCSVCGRPTGGCCTVINDEVEWTD